MCALTNKEGHKWRVCVCVCLTAAVCDYVCLFDFITRASTALRQNEDEKGFPLCAAERRNVVELISHLRNHNC